MFEEKHYKVEIECAYTSVNVHVTVMATSEANAELRLIARCFCSPFNPVKGSAVEITEDEAKEINEKLLTLSKELS